VTADGNLVTRRAADGVELWRRRLPRAATSRPSFTMDRLFVATEDKRIVALDLKTGDVVWTQTLNGTGHDILADEDRIFFGSQDRFFYCLNAKDGVIEWRWKTGADAIGLPVGDDRTVYFVSLDNVLRGVNRSSGVQRWKTPLNFRPMAGPMKWSETLVVAASAPQLEAFGVRDGKTLGRFAAAAELAALSAPPHLFVDPARVFPVLVTISSDIVGRATVTGVTRNVEPTPLQLLPLPDATTLPSPAEPPADLGRVSPLPNLTPVVPAAEQ
jgi:outer membrane protein assembly factor BamB